MSSYTPVSLIQTDEGVEMSIRAIAGASRNEITGIRDGSLVVRITTAPEKGKANQAIVDLLARSLAMRKKDLRWIRGERHRNKCILLCEADLDHVQKLLSRWTGPQKDQ
ncbi:MAG: DUF167 domain-containing protein [Planctomycetota bacterium]|jgi:hypothetical protein|nr:DUF167 domain-containing protein [Planctomycetota bacterium]